MAFGDQLKEARKKAGMTQAELAAAVYTTKAAISRYESNQRVPREEIFTRLCVVLQIDLDEMHQLATMAGISGAQLSKGVNSLFEWFDKVLEDDDVGDNRKKPTARQKMLDAFDQLNPSGQQEAVKRVEELTEIPKYQKAKEPPQP